MIQLTTLPFLTKVIVILSVLLFLSFGLNTYQLYHSGVVSGRDEKQQEVDTLVAKNLGLEKTAAVNSAIADLARRDTSQLIEDMRFITDNAEGVKIVYREIASKAPLPINCAPGAPRVKTVNKALGAQQ